MNDVQLLELGCLAGVYARVCRLDSTVVDPVT